MFFITIISVLILETERLAKNQVLETTHFYLIIFLIATFTNTLMATQTKSTNATVFKTKEMFLI